MVEKSVVRLWGSLSCRGSAWSFPEFWELWELGWRHRSALNRPRIWRGRLPPRPCRPGKVKRKSGWPCSPRRSRWKTPFGGTVTVEMWWCIRCHVSGSRVLWNREMKWVAPRLRMHATAVLLLQYTLTVWLCHWGPHWKMANRSASNSSQLICWSWSWGDHCPESWCSCQLAPHPVREASVKKNRLGSGAWSRAPWSTSGLLNHRRWDRYSVSSWIWESQGWECCYGLVFIQNWRKRSCRCPWWIKGA